MSVVTPILTAGITISVALIALSTYLRSHRIIEKPNDEENVRWSDAFDALSDAYVLVDTNDYIISANKAFYELIGKTESNAQGQKVGFLIHGDESHKNCDACQHRTLQLNATLTKEHDDTSNPTNKPVEINIRVIKNKTGSIIATLQSFHDISHLRRAEEKLLKSEHKLAEAQKIGHMGSWEWDLLEDRFEWSDEMWRIFGCPNVSKNQNNYIGFMRRIHKQDRAKVRDSIQSFIKNKSNDFSLNHRITLPNGEIRFVHQKGKLHYSKDNRCVRLIGITHDISQQKHIEDKLIEEKEKAQVTLQSIGDAVITMDVNGIIDYINPIAEHLLLRKKNEIIGEHHTNILKFIDENTRKPITDPVRRSLINQKEFFHEQILFLRPDNTEFSIAITTSPIVVKNKIVTGVSLVIHDVTEMRSLTKQLNFQATHDSLTGLVNRREFESRLKKAIAERRHQNNVHALIYMDLDQFKIVNDTCGHIAGDELLKQVSQLLHSKIRSVDTLARLGGDEFAVILNSCPAQVAQSIAEEIRLAIESYRFAWEDKLFKIGVSIGLIPIDQESGSHTEILKKADTACYVAKDSGRNRIYTYDEDNRSLDQHHGEMQWAQRISQSLEKNHFQLYCQKIQPMNGKSNALHFEVLLRIRDLKNEIILPQAFIPAAERYQLMPSIDRWVIENTFAALQKYNANQENVSYICSINLSAQSLCDESLLSFITEKLDKYEIDPRNFCFEITETTAIANLTSAIRFINVLRDMGFYFALDDFGSGLSSFDYLKNLKIDYLKIDGSFVKEIANDSVNHAMVRSINEIGHIMGVKTIAEYVENDVILSIINELDIDYGQGNFLGEPLSMQNFLKSP